MKNILTKNTQKVMESLPQKHKDTIQRAIDKNLKWSIGVINAATSEYSRGAMEMSFLLKMIESAVKVGEDAQNIPTSNRNSYNKTPQKIHPMKIKVK